MRARVTNRVIVVAEGEKEVLVHLLLEQKYMQEMHEKYRKPVFTKWNKRRRSK